MAKNTSKPPAFEPGETNARAVRGGPNAAPQTPQRDARAGADTTARRTAAGRPADDAVGDDLDDVSGADPQTEAAANTTNASPATTTRTPATPARPARPARRAAQTAKPKRRR